MEDRVIHKWDVRVVNDYGITQHNQSFNSFEKAHQLYSEMKCVLYTDEKVAIIPMRANEYER